ENARIGVNAAIAQERPVAADLLDAAAVAFHDERLFAILRRFRQHLAERIGNEGRAPKLEAAIRGALKTDTVYGGDIDAVRNGVRTLDRAPCVVLGCSVLLFFSRMPADGGRIEQHVSATERRQARRFGIPLIPANQ